MTSIRATAGQTGAVPVPAAVDAEAADAARRVLEVAPATDVTLALVSGGHDSLTALHVAQQSTLVYIDGVVHVNTGIGVPETRAFVRERASALGLDYYEVGAVERTAKRDYRPASRTYRLPSEEYVTLVRTFGFPGPPVHRWMYVNLKEKPLDRFLRDRYPDREVTLVTGVRRHESDRRMENVGDAGVDDYLGCVAVSPLVEFRGLDVTRYRAAVDLPSNPVVERLEMSGECCCGSYASRGELRDLRTWYPAVYRYILALEAQVTAASYVADGPDRQYTKWGHGRLADREVAAMTDPDQALLCESCEWRSQCTRDRDVRPDRHPEDDRDATADTGPDADSGTASEPDTRPDPRADPDPDPESDLDPSPGPNRSPEMACDGGDGR